MRRAAVIHPCLTVFGGAELVALQVMKLLLDDGWDLTLLSDGWDPVEAFHRFGLKFDRAVPWLHYGRRGSPRIPFLSLYQSLMKDLARSVGAPRLGPADLVFDTYNGEGYLVEAEENLRIIYFHEVPRYIFNGDGGLRHLYHALPRAWWRRFTDTLRRAIPICNSSYTLNLLREMYGVEGAVVYPPAQVEGFLPLAGLEPRDDVAVTLARFAPDKRLDVAVRAFPAVVEQIPDARLVMIGSTREESSGIALKELGSLISALKLDGKVQLIRDAPLPQVKAMLRRAKILISTKPNEPFGTAVLQGMASGCIPIVHRSGGQYTDLTAHGAVGLSYEEPGELSEQIIRVLESEGFRVEMKRKVVERAEQFKTDRFEEAMRRLIRD